MSSNTMKDMGDATRAKILAHLEANGEAKASDIAAIIKRNPSSTFLQLRRLELANQIHRYRTYGKRNAVEFVWRLGPDDGQVPDLEIRRPRCTSWVPHNFCDPMVAALFGHLKMESCA